METIKIKKSYGKNFIIILSLLLLGCGVYVLFFMNERQVSKDEAISKSARKFDFIKKLDTYLTISSESEKTDLRSEFEKNAVVSSTISLTNCIPSPRIVALKQDTELTIKNSDNSSHRLTFNEDHIYDIEKNESKVIMANFGNGMGMYTFSCDTLGRVGVIFTTL